MPRKIGAGRKTGSARFGTSQTYWYAVRNTAAIEGRTIAAVRKDATFQSRWELARAIWDYELRDRQVEDDRKRGLISHEEYIRTRFKLDHEVVGARGRHLAIAYNTPMSEVVSHQHGGTYADTLEKLHLRLPGIPQSVGDTPKAQRYPNPRTIH